VCSVKITAAMAERDEDERNRRYSQSLERGLAVLGCFTAERRVLGITDIAEQLGLNKSTTHRYATTLVALGYLEQKTGSPKYRLSLRVLDLGMSVLNAQGLREHARPEMEELRRASGYTVNLGLLDGSEIVCLDRARGFRGERSEIDLDVHPGSRLPAYCTALGKLLLAQLPEQEQRRRIAAMPRLQKRAPHTIVSKKRLLSELEGVGAEGLAVNDEECCTGEIAIARPVRDGVGEVLAAVSLSAHTSAMSPEQMCVALDPHLTVTADRISARMGFRHGNER
jgi:IclR family transcriptional regulator, pca regulon regulatory protein